MVPCVLTQAVRGHGPGDGTSTRSSTWLWIIGSVHSVLRLEGRGEGVPSGGDVE